MRHNSTVNELFLVYLPELAVREMVVLVTRSFETVFQSPEVLTSF